MPSGPALPAGLWRWLLAPAPLQRVVAAAAALVLIAGLFYQGAQSHAVDPLAVPGTALARLLLYLGLGLLVSVALGGRRYWITLALCALVSGSDELAQVLGPGGDVELAGWLVDVGGAALGGALRSGLRRAAQPASLPVEPDAAPIR